MAEGRDTTSKIKLQWSDVDKAPQKLDSSYGAAVVSSTTAYFYHMSDEIRAYDTRSNKWTSVPNPPHMGYSLVFVNDKLTAVGGGYFLHYTNKLYSLSGEGIDLSWNEDFQPMPTKRANTITLSTATALIVAGGKKTGSLFGDGDSLAVEVMNTETLQWSIAAPFPTSLLDGTAVICQDNIYVAAMRQTDHSKHLELVPTAEVYTCSITDLLQSCSRPGLLTYFASALSISTAKAVWKRAADLPVSQTSCVSVHNQLMAIGGRDSDGDATTAVHMYDPVADSWNVISHMLTPRIKCFAVVLPDNKLMVVGGYTNDEVTVIQGRKIGDTTESVEIASLE